MTRTKAIVLSIALAMVVPVALMAQSFINSYVAVCDPAAPSHCLKPTTAGAINIAGTVPLPTGAATSALQTSTMATNHTDLAAILAGPLPVAGTVASGAADSGNPVKVGAKYNLTLPTFTDGQRGDLQIGSRGSLGVSIFSTNGTIGAAVSQTGSDGKSNGTAVLETSANSSIFNGSTWDRNINCANTAAISVTAGNTTEIVALTASQVIRVCGFSVSISLAGTAQWIYGTGTNCGTGTTVITPVWQFAAAGNLTIEGAFWKGLLVPPLTDVCITSSGAVASQAVIFYSQQ